MPCCFLIFQIIDNNQQSFLKIVSFIKPSSPRPSLDFVVHNRHNFSQWLPNERKSVLLTADCWLLLAVLLLLLSVVDVAAMVVLVKCLLMLFSVISTSGEPLRRRHAKMSSLAAALLLLLAAVVAVLLLSLFSVFNEADRLANEVVRPFMENCWPPPLTELATLPFTLL